MGSSAIQSAWPVLAVLAYVLVTCVLTVLTSTRKKAIDMHDRVRECMELRLEHRRRREEAARLARGEDPADTNVEVVE